MTNEPLISEQVLDLAEAMTNMDGDAELLQEIVEIFMETAVPQFDSIAQCIKIDEVNQVAIQAHAMFIIPELGAFRKFLSEIASMGLKIEIAEMDARLRLFANEEDPYQAQGDFYREFTRVCLEIPAVEGITVWGISDPGWYNSLGVFNWHKPNNSVLLDSLLNPKPSYFGMLEALTN